MNQVFDSIESAHEYVGLLLQAIEQTASEVGQDLGRARYGRSPQRLEAFRLVAYKLEQLRMHIDASYRQLNDLRLLHRALEEGSAATVAR